MDPHDVVLDALGKWLADTAAHNFDGEQHHKVGRRGLGTSSQPPVGMLIKLLADLCNTESHLAFSQLSQQDVHTISTFGPSWGSMMNPDKPPQMARAMGLIKKGA